MENRILLEEIKRKCDKCLPTLVRGKIRKEGIPLYREENFKSADEADLKMSNFWLDRLVVHVDAYDRIWNMVPAGAWDNYIKMGVKGLWEQDQLKIARENLLAFFTTRPEIFKNVKKKRKSKQKDGTKSGVSGKENGPTD